MSELDNFDRAETTAENPRSWIAWKRQAEGWHAEVVRLREERDRDILMIQVKARQLQEAEAELAALRTQLRDLADELMRNGTDWPSPDLRVASQRIAALLTDPPASEMK